MRFILILLILFISNCTYSQKQDRNEVLLSQISEIKTMPYIPELSGDSIFWELVKCKKSIVPQLINQLDNNTITEAFVPNIGGNYTVADISLMAIMEIIKGVPIKKFIPDFKEANGFTDYWQYVRADIKNREMLKQQVSKWYNANRSKLVWVEDNAEYRTSIDWKFDSNKHPSGGYYSIK